MNPHYVTVYQISAMEAYSSPADLVKFVPVAFGIVALIFGIGLILHIPRSRLKASRWIASTGLCAFGVISLCILAPPILRRDKDALSAFQRGDYRVVKGRVADFDPMPYDGHKEECFSVQDRRFCYSDFMPGSGLPENYITWWADPSRITGAGFLHTYSRPQFDFAS